MLSIDCRGLSRNRFKLKPPLACNYEIKSKSQAKKVKTGSRSHFLEIELIWQDQIDRFWSNFRSIFLLKRTAFDWIVARCWWCSVGELLIRWSSKLFGWPPPKLETKISNLGIRFGTNVEWSDFAHLTLCIEFYRFFSAFSRSLWKDPWSLGSCFKKINMVYLTCFKHSLALSLIWIRSKVNLLKKFVRKIGADQFELFNSHCWNSYGCNRLALSLVQLRLVSFEDKRIRFWIYSEWFEQTLFNRDFHLNILTLKFLSHSRVIRCRERVPFSTAKVVEATADSAWTEHFNSLNFQAITFWWTVFIEHTWWLHRLLLEESFKRKSSNRGTPAESETKPTDKTSSSKHCNLDRLWLERERERSIKYGCQWIRTVCTSNLQLEASAQCVST